MNPIIPQLVVNGVAILAGLVAIAYYLKVRSSFGGGVGKSLKVFVASMLVWMTSFTLCMLRGIGKISMKQIHLKLIGGSAFLLFAYGFYRLNQSLKTLES